MTRLDKFLVENNLIPTRSRAKRAILYGLIKVNGKIIQKPAYSIKSNDKIEIINELASRSAGYWKLHGIIQKLKIKVFNFTDTVLDLGSSAGGFLEFAAERCKHVIGIEISTEFESELRRIEQKYSNISLFIADVFTLDLNKISDIEPVDVILNDLTLEPTDSAKVLSKFLRLLKPHGYVIMAVKQGSYSLEACEDLIQNIGKTMELKILQIINLDPDKKELHFLAQK